jgi:hypothetical protein
MKYLASVAFGVGLLALPVTASAAIVCNDDGDCWRTKKSLTYPPEARVQIYDDDWVMDTKKYKWREARPGRGYWRGGVWVGF